jgi:hypothetical protein
MDAFYATLSQIIATLLAILGAAVGGYIVFLQERTSQFDEQIDRDRIAISDVLLEMQGFHGQTIINLSHFLPGEFAESYRLKTGNKSGADLLQQAATDLVFRGAQMQKTWEELTPADTLGGPWSGRTYIWIVAQTSNFLTRRSMPGQAQPGTGVFPFSPLGPGFEEWERDFTQAQGAINLLLFARSDALKDFQLFLNHPPAGIPRPGLFDLSNEAVNEWFDQINALRAKLADEQIQVKLKTSYSFRKRVNVFSLSSLVFLSFLIGVFYPLFALALRQNISSVAAVPVLIATLLLTAGAFASFAFDVGRTQPPDLAGYLVGRWYSPLLMELKNQTEKAQRGGLVDRGLFVDASTSSDRSQFPGEIGKALDSYAKCVDDYNGKALKLNAMVVDSLRDDVALKPLIVKPQDAGEGFGLVPLDLADSGRVDKVKNSYATKNASVTFSLEMPQWITTALVFRKAESDPEVSLLNDRISQVANRVKNSRELADYLASRSNLIAAGKHLELAVSGQIPAPH